MSQFDNKSSLLYVMVCRLFGTNHMYKTSMIQIADTHIRHQTSVSAPYGVHAVYRQISNTRRTNTHNFNVSCLVLQLSLPKLLMPGIKSRMKM